MKNLFAILALSIFSLQMSFGQAEVIETFKVSEKSSVDLKLNYAKDIKIDTWNKNEVKVLAKVVLGKKSTRDGFDLTINKLGNKISVQSALDYEKVPTREIEPDKNGNINQDGIAGNIWYNNGVWQSLSYELIYEIKVPEYLAISLCTNRGNVEVKGVNAPMEIVTNNGFIDVARNPSNKADVRFVTNTGEIFTDFDIDYDGSNDKKKRNTCEAIKVEAAINGGGGDGISLTSTCGNIYFRKSK